MGCDLYWKRARRFRVEKSSYREQIPPRKMDLEICFGARYLLEKADLLQIWERGPRVELKEGPWVLWDRPLEVYPKIN